MMWMYLAVFTTQTGTAFQIGDAEGIIWVGGVSALLAIAGTCAVVVANVAEIVDRYARRKTRA